MSQGVVLYSGYLSIVNIFQIIYEYYIHKYYKLYSYIFINIINKFIIALFIL